MAVENLQFVSPVDDRVLFWVANVSSQAGKGLSLTSIMEARYRLAGSDLTFWPHLLNGIPMTLVALYPRRGLVRVSLRKSWKIGMLGGMITLLAYWIVTWTMAKALLALVSAVRETSMVFAVLFAVFILKERLDLARLSSIGIH